MEFFLIDEKPFSMDKGECDQQFVLEALALYYCKSLLNNTSVSISLPLVKETDKYEIYPTLQLQLLSPIRNGHPQKLSFRVYSNDGINILKVLRAWCGQQNVCINLKVTTFKGDGMGDGVDCFEATDLPIKDLDIDDRVVCGSETSDFNLDTRSKIRGFITVSIKFTEHAVGQLFLQRFSQSNLPGGNKRLLEDAISTDLVIVAANGAEIKCHRAMLAGRSDVFRSMFENKMKESITGVVQMRDMSEQAVRAFLDFIYHWNMKEASESCDIALEMLVAADKYIVPNLVSAISELIGFMPNKWFNVDMSVKLLVFTEKKRRICRNIVLVELQEKVIRVLKSHTKDCFDILLKSPVYQELFEDIPEIAMGIIARFLMFNE